MHHTRNIKTFLICSSCLINTSLNFGCGYVILSRFVTRCQFRVIVVLLVQTIKQVRILELFLGEGEIRVYAIKPKRWTEWDDKDRYLLANVILEIEHWILTKSLELATILAHFLLFNFFKLTMHIFRFVLTWLLLCIR